MIAKWCVSDGTIESEHAERPAAHTKRHEGDSFPIVSGAAKTYRPDNSRTSRPAQAGMTEPDHVTELDGTLSECPLPGIGRPGGPVASCRRKHAPVRAAAREHRSPWRTKHVDDFAAQRGQRVVWIRLADHRARQTEQHLRFGRPATGFLRGPP